MILVNGIFLWLSVLLEWRASIKIQSFYRDNRVNNGRFFLFLLEKMEFFREKCLEILPDFQSFSAADVFLSELLEYNQKVNLISRSSGEKMAKEHFFDCFIAIPHFLEAIRAFSFKKSSSPKILDVGSGGGFPAVVLALAMPDVLVTGVESKKKKVDFLFYIIEKIGLKNFLVEHRNVSMWQPKQNYQIITARAFASLTKIVRQTLHLLDDRGGYLLYKGREQKVEEEVKDFWQDGVVKKRLGHKKLSTIPLKNSSVNAERCLVKIQ